jgi:hypothetical protein
MTSRPQVHRQAQSERALEARTLAHQQSGRLAKILRIVAEEFMRCSGRNPTEFFRNGDQNVSKETLAPGQVRNAPQCRVIGEVSPSLWISFQKFGC